MNHRDLINKAAMEALISSVCGGLILVLVSPVDMFGFGIVLVGMCIGLVRLRRSIDADLESLRLTSKKVFFFGLAALPVCAAVPEPVTTWMAAGSFGLICAGYCCYTRIERTYGSDADAWW